MKRKRDHKAGLTERDVSKRAKTALCITVESLPKELWYLILDKIQVEVTYQRIGSLSKAFLWLFLEYVQHSLSSRYTLLSVYQNHLFEDTKLRFCSFHRLSSLEECYKFTHEIPERDPLMDFVLQTDMIDTNRAISAFLQFFSTIHLDRERKSSEPPVHYRMRVSNCLADDSGLWMALIWRPDKNTLGKEQGLKILF